MKYIKMPAQCLIPRTRGYTSLMNLVDDFFPGRYSAMVLRIGTREHVAMTQEYRKKFLALVCGLASSAALVLL